MQLDIRSSGHPAVRTLWDSRTIHKGHLIEEMASWSPPLLRPAIFDWKKDGWTVALRKEGYVAIGGVLTTREVNKACALLSTDVSLIEKEARQIKECRSSLLNVKDRHLPPYDNAGLRAGNGLSHGESSWFLSLAEDLS